MPKEVLRALESLKLLLDPALTGGIVLDLNDLESDLKLGDGFVALTLTLVSQTKIVVGAHEVWHQSTDLLPGSNGHLDIALAEIGRSHLEMSLDMLRVQQHHTLILPDGRLEAVLIQMLVAQPVVIPNLVTGSQGP